MKGVEMFDHWYTDYIDDENKPVREAAKAAWDFQQHKIDEIEKENAKLREEVEDLNRENENLWHAQREGL